MKDKSANCGKPAACAPLLLYTERLNVASQEEEPGQIFFLKCKYVMSQLFDWDRICRYSWLVRNLEHSSFILYRHGVWY